MKLEYSPVIENVIEITKVFEEMKSLYSDEYNSYLGKNDFPYTEEDRLILDWGNEFEASVGESYCWDESDYDYIELIWDFATMKIMDLLEVPIYRRPNQQTDMVFLEGRWF